MTDPRREFPSENLAGGRIVTSSLRDMYKNSLKLHFANS